MSSSVDESALRAHAIDVARQSRQSPPLTGSASTYGGYAHRVARWIELVDRGARTVRIGETVGGLPLFGLELGATGASQASMLVAGVHALEWIGVAVGEALAARLVADPPTDRRVLIVPLANPDGLCQVERDLRARKARFRRPNGHGVDLNRNWPTHHRRWTLGGMLKPLLGDSGATPLSQPEVAAIVAWGDRVVADGARIDRALSLHSYGRMILYPFGGRWRPPERVSELRAAARAVASRISGEYRVAQAARWVPGLFAHGMEIDTMHERWGALALLIECSAGGLSLRAPFHTLQPFRWFNPERSDADVEELAPALEWFIRGCDVA